MNQKPNVQNRWWVETYVPTASRSQSSRSPDKQLPGMHLYRVAEGYNQEVAKENLTDTNLKILREANPPANDWGYLAMTATRYPTRLVRRIKDTLRLPPGARGAIVDHGNHLRIIICGPEAADWMIDVNLTEEPSVDVYVRGTLHRERLFRRAESALRQARRWARNLVEHPPKDNSPLRGALL